MIYLAFLMTIGAFLVFLARILAKDAAHFERTGRNGSLTQKVKSVSLWFLAIFLIGVLRIETERGQLSSIFSYTGQIDSYICIASFVSAGAVFLVTLFAERKPHRASGEEK